MKIDFYYLTTNKKNQGVIYNEGVAALLAVAKARGAEVSLQLLDLAEALRGFPVDSLADYHAVSFTSLQFALAQRVIRAIGEKRGRGRILAGGIHATVARESVAALPGVDATVSGEGEAVITWLAGNPDSPLDTCPLPNIAFKGRPLPPLQKAVFMDLDALPFPDRTLFDRALLARTPEFILSRGCPFRCAYCVNEFLNGRFGMSVRKKTPEYATAEIEDARNLLKFAPGATLTFHDDVFLANTSWLESLAALYRERIGNPFRCNTTASAVSAQNVKLLKEMNCGEVWIGIESGDESFRRSILNKQVADAQIREAFSLVRAQSMTPIGFILMGCPGETRKHIFRTIRFVREIDARYLTVALFVPFPGTSLYDQEAARDNVRPIGERLGDRGVSFSGLKRKPVSDFEYFHYMKFIIYHAQRKAWLYPAVFLLNLPGISLLKPLFKAIMSPFRKLLLQRKGGDRGATD